MAPFSTPHLGLIDSGRQERRQAEAFLEEAAFQPGLLPASFLLCSEGGLKFWMETWKVIIWF